MAKLLFTTKPSRHEKSFSAIDRFQSGRYEWAWSHIVSPITDQNTTPIPHSTIVVVAALALQLATTTLAVSRCSTDSECPKLKKIHAGACIIMMTVFTIEVVLSLLRGQTMSDVERAIDRAGDAMSHDMSQVASTSHQSPSTPTAARLAQRSAALFRRAVHVRMFFGATAGHSSSRTRCCCCGTFGIRLMWLSACILYFLVFFISTTVLTMDAGDDFQGHSAWKLAVALTPLSMLASCVARAIQVWELYTVGGTGKESGRQRTLKIWDLYRTKYVMSSTQRGKLCVYFHTPCT